MLTSRPFSFDHARPPEGKAFAADRLRQYAGHIKPADTTVAKGIIKQLEGSLDRQKRRAITIEDQLKIERGEMALPDHIRELGPIENRVHDVASQLVHLNFIVGTADAHNEAIASGMKQVSNAGADHE